MNIWKDRKNVDLWSLVHFLSGFILGGLFYWFEVSLIPSIILSIILLILWEIFEFVIKIIEPSLNVFIDILVGILGLALAVWIYYSNILELNTNFFIIIIMITLGLSLFGFTNYLKKH